MKLCYKVAKAWERAPKPGGRVCVCIHMIGPKIHSVKESPTERHHRVLSGKTGIIEDCTLDSALDGHSSFLEHIVV